MVWVRTMYYLAQVNMAPVMIKVMQTVADFSLYMIELMSLVTWNICYWAFGSGSKVLPTRQVLDKSCKGLQSAAVANWGTHNYMSMHSACNQHWPAETAPLKSRTTGKQACGTGAPPHTEIPCTNLRPVIHAPTGERARACSVSGLSHCALQYPPRQSEPPLNCRCRPLPYIGLTDMVLTCNSWFTFRVWDVSEF